MHLLRTVVDDRFEYLQTAEWNRFLKSQMKTLFPDSASLEKFFADFSVAGFGQHFRWETPAIFGVEEAYLASASSSTRAKSHTPPSSSSSLTSSSWSQPMNQQQQYQQQQQQQQRLMKSQQGPLARHDVALAALKSKFNGADSHGMGTWEFLKAASDLLPNHWDEVGLPYSA